MKKQVIFLASAMFFITIFANKGFTAEINTWYVCTSQGEKPINYMVFNQSKDGWVKLPIPLIPDDAMVNVDTNEVFVVEVNAQQKRKGKVPYKCVPFQKFP